MQKKFGLFTIAVFALSLVAASGVRAIAAEFEINIAHIVNVDHSWHKASVRFKEFLEKESNGRIQVKLYPNNQIGTEMDVLNSIMSDGGADLTFTGESMQSVIPEMGILGVPYLMNSDEHVKAVIEGDIGKRLEKLMAEQANMVVLGYFARGPRHLTANRPIRTTDDMKGLILRVPAAPITVSAMEALGAKVTPMAFSEVFSSLQQKTVEAIEMPMAMIKTGNFYEVQKYLNKTEHLRSIVYIVMRKTGLEAMPKDLQDMVFAAGREMQRHEHELFLKDEEEVEAFLKDKGMIFVDVDLPAFVNVVSTGVEKVMPKPLQSMYAEIKAMKF